MNRLDVILELLTPAFLSGADQNEIELRSQSIKGVLRWWWRAVVGKNFQQLEALKKAEGELFGSAEMKLKSPLLIQLSWERGAGALKTVDYGGGCWKSGKRIKSGRYELDAIEYLAYGPVATVGRKEIVPEGKTKTGLVLKRPAFDVGNKFVLSLEWRNDSLEEEALGQLLEAVGAWIAFGGIGSRSRKGWGAVDLVDVKHEPKSLEEEARSQIEHARKEFMKDPGSISLARVPSWPTVESRRLCAQVGPSNDWKQVLGELGVRYKGLKTTVPKANHWIFGSANPRRASSVLLTVKKDSAGRLMGFIWAFPSRKSATEEGATGWEQFLRICSPPGLEKSKGVRK